MRAGEQSSCTSEKKTDPATFAHDLHASLLRLELCNHTCSLLLYFPFDLCRQPFVTVQTSIYPAGVERDCMLFLFLLFPIMYHSLCRSCSLHKREKRAAICRRYLMFPIMNKTRVVNSLPKDDTVQAALSFCNNIMEKFTLNS